MGEFLTPVLALILWTFVMWVLMYKRRIPAMQKMKLDPQEWVKNPKLGDQLPASARWSADNYNHLHEQPVIFYALMFYLQLSGNADSAALYLAWAYVAIRVVHSVVQVTSNHVMTRFSMFVVGSFLLLIMALRAAAALF